jgi:uncharacterized Tic20 family protein
MAEEQMSRHPSEPPADWLSSAGEATARPAPGEALPQRPAPPAPRVPDYPPMPDYPPAPGYPPGTGYLSAPGYPGYPPAYAAAGTAEPGYPGYPPAPGGETGPAIDHDEYAATHGGYGPARGEGYRPGEHDLDPHGLVPSEYGVVYDDYGRPHGVPAGPPPEARAPYGPAAAAPGAAGPGAAGALLSGDSARWAMLAYLTVPLFGFAVPLVVYLRTRRGPGWTRAHAAQALNVWITTAIYGISAVIMGTMLALDSPQVALIVFGPVLAGLWLVALTFLVRAATAASRGQAYTFPRWLCSRVLR